MNEDKYLKQKAMEFLLKTSRTFFIPISQLPEGLKETVGAAYLCMRAIDEIEDHPSLPKETKIHLLNSVGKLLQNGADEDELTALLDPHSQELPEVSLLLKEWIMLIPQPITEKVLEATSIMAHGMAKWTEKDWQIHTEEELDDYTYYVAGLVGVMLSDIWEWYDGTESDRELAIAFGRGLQTVNILRNRTEDAERGVNFFPEGWNFERMLSFTEKNLSLADRYLEGIETKVIFNFCNIPLALAKGTLQALKDGREKLTRKDVADIVSGAVE
ncbi:phytoene/squalene synthase family protein [Bacillus sp. MUM 13]|uniref:squalene/phytoene synthase family protein n=1 Tax=Bacillus sp. MUM 13 TaxID=1678001 RepID=UPI0008F56910|nr:phytoene/squalene synthase family protein [Bacillus sp. MUM 13]OIK09306.1 phytoene/squalene synthase family protein [Bacillus sp. MUM 13]